MNTIQILGRLGADPEERFTKSGQKVTNLRVATNVYQNGEEQTVWYRVTIWGENPIVKHLKKGSAVVVSGELKKPDIWTDRNGTNQVSLEINAHNVRFAPFGGKNDNQSAPDEQGQPATATVQGQAPASQEPDSDDDLPF